MRLNNPAFMLGAAILITQTAAADTIYLEEDGKVAFEVENHSPVEGWTATTEIEGYSGDSYLEWTGPNQFGESVAGRGKLTYTFRITNPGNYEIRWRNRIARGTMSTEHNDSWMRLPTGADIADEEPLSGWVKAYMSRLDTWRWDTKTVDHTPVPIRQYFNEGDHTIEISGRSAGHALDRVVIFKYDTVNFRQDVFDSLPSSETSSESGTPGGGEPAPTPDPDPEPDPEPEPEPDPNAEDWSITEPLETAGECEANTLALAPVADIYVQNSTVSDSLELRVDGIDRNGLMQFDLSLVPASKTQAQLAFFIGDDDGEGTIGLYAGSHSNWTETDSNLSDVPTANFELGSYTGAFRKDTRFGLPFDVNLLSSESETLLLEMSADSNDLSILSSESPSGPRLLISGGESFCTDYAQLQEQNQPEPEPEPEPDPAPEPEPDPEVPPVAGKDTKTDEEASSSGYLILSGLLGLLAWRRGRQNKSG